MAESDFAAIDGMHRPDPSLASMSDMSASGISRGVRAAWSAPLVIASELRAAKAHVGNGADGSSPGYGLYGS